MVLENRMLMFYAFQKCQKGSLRDLTGQRWQRKLWDRWRRKREPCPCRGSFLPRKTAKDRRTSLPFGLFVEHIGFEPTTSSMPWRRAPSCANAPTCAYRLIIPDSHGLRNQNFSIFHQFLFLLPLAIIAVCIAPLPSPAGKDPAGFQLLLQRFWITGRIQGSLHAEGDPLPGHTP